MVQARKRIMKPVVGKFGVELEQNRSFERNGPDLVRSSLDSSVRPECWIGVGSRPVILDRALPLLMAGLRQATWVLNS